MLWPCALFIVTANDNFIGYCQRLSLKGRVVSDNARFILGMNRLSVIHLLFLLQVQCLIFLIS